MGQRLSAWLEAHVAARGHWVHTRALLALADASFAEALAATRAERDADAQNALRTHVDACSEFLRAAELLIAVPSGLVVRCLDSLASAMRAGNHPATAVDEIEARALRIHALRAFL
eukprot:Amastigsp_a339379_252.p4 type:complete len:116 gc:universal Amastigsp_a339379_252:1125-778(-)